MMDLHPDSLPQLEFCSGRAYIRLRNDPENGMPALGRLF
jgi:hypothetical protein